MQQTLQQFERPCVGELGGDVTLWVTLGAVMRSMASSIWDNNDAKAYHNNDRSRWIFLANFITSNHLSNWPCHFLTANSNLDDQIACLLSQKAYCHGFCQVSTTPKDSQIDECLENRRISRRSDKSQTRWIFFAQVRTTNWSCDQEVFFENEFEIADGITLIYIKISAIPSWRDCDLCDPLT